MERLLASSPVGDPNEDLQRRLTESEEVLRAISGGEVDAFVVSRDDNPQIITLSTADRAYRSLTEKIVQGAVTVAADATILYANGPFARLVGTTPDELPGTSLAGLVIESDVPMLKAMLARAGGEQVVAEIAFKRDSGTFPTQIEMYTPYDDARAICIVVTDLSEQRRHEAVLAAEALGRAILEQALDAVIVCDLRGIVVRASASSHALCGCNPLLQPFMDVFPVVGSQESLKLSAILRGQALRNAPFEMVQGGRRISLLVSAGPVVDAAGDVVACVITMTDVTELRRVETELKAADARKDEMFAVVVHELRNPVSNISLVADILSIDPLDSRRLAHVRDSLKRGIDQISRLVEDLTDFNRIRLHKLKLRPEVLDLRDVVRNAVAGREALLAARAQTIEVLLPDAPVQVYADDSRLTQVFINLINNANKFTHDGGFIRLRLDVDEAARHAVVSIADNGMGMAPPLLAKIFNAFEQGVVAGGQSGLGIGLTLSRRIVELHAGTIDATSDGPGRGSTFTVRLPLHTRSPER